MFEKTVRPFLLSKDNNPFDRSQYLIQKKLNPWETD